MKHSRCFFAAALVALPMIVAAQDTRPAVPLAGLKYVRIHPVTTGDSRAARLDLPALLEQELAAQGWVILTGSEDLLRADAREKASQAVLCVLDIDYSGFGTKAQLTCQDVLGREMFTAVDRAVAFSMDGEVRAAVRNVAKAIQQERKAFDPRQTIDIVARLPATKTHSVTRISLEEMARSGKLTEPVEGLWAFATDGDYRVGIVRDGPDFVVVVLESPQTYLWQPGMVRARLTPAAEGQTFLARWTTVDRRDLAGFAVLKGAVLEFILRDEGKEQTIPLVKLRSAGNASATAEPSARPLASTGTGFVCAPGIVATNHHVVAGAREIEFFLPVQNRSVKMEAIVSDPANDIALLRARDPRDVLPSALSLGDSRSVKLATEAYVIGFPLGETLGTGHKVTSGLVSGLEGLKGDPRELQITAPIQPGSSGSPVLDTDGRVIGIITSMFDSVAGLRVSGQIPQNVNFALKTDYISLLLRHVTPSAEPLSQERLATTKATDMVESARMAVGLVRVIR